MILRKWEDMPPDMQTAEVREYYDILRKKRASLLFKRLFDIMASLVLLIVLSPLLLILAIAVRLDSEGPVFFRQERVTQYGRRFRIFKLRSMTVTSYSGAALTVSGDPRITRVGRFIRKYRLDELPQLIDVLRGTMTFVGTRPEVTKYTDLYTPEMMATLLLPAGITSLASIYYKDETALLDSAENADRIYVEKILPAKMRYNLAAIKKFNFLYDIKIMLMTVLAVLGKDYEESNTDVREKTEDSEK